MPGDCSPSRRVVSKIRTRLTSSLMTSPSGPSSLLLLGSRLQRPPRITPPEGGGEGEGKGRARNASEASSLHRQHYLADVLALAHEAVRVANAVDDQVKRRLISRDPPHFVGEVVGAVVDRVLDAELPDGVVLGRRRRSKDLRAEQLADLRGGDAHAAGRRLYEEPLSSAQV